MNPANYNYYPNQNFVNIYHDPNYVNDPNQNQVNLNNTFQGQGFFNNGYQDQHQGYDNGYYVQNQVYDHGYPNQNQGYDNGHQIQNFGNNAFQNQDYGMEYYDQGNGYQAAFENNQQHNNYILEEDNFEQNQGIDQSFEEEKTIVKQKQKRAPRKMTRELTETWVKEFSATQSLKDLTMTKILFYVSCYRFDVVRIESSKYRVHRLGFTLNMHSNKIFDNKSKSFLNSLVYEPNSRKITEVEISKDFLNNTLGENLSNRITSLNDKFTNMYPFLSDVFYMGLCNPIKLDSILKDTYEECESFSNDPVYQKIGINQSNFSCVLKNNLEPQIFELTQAHFPERFLMNDIWNSCLLSRADNDMNSPIINSQVKPLVEFLWYKKIYNKWNDIILKKFHLISLLLITDVNMQIKHGLYVLSLDQPLDEILGTQKQSNQNFQKMEPDFDHPTLTSNQRLKRPMIDRDLNSDLAEQNEQKEPIAKRPRFARPNSTARCRLTDRFSNAAHTYDFEVPQCIHLG